MTANNPHSPGVPHRPECPHYRKAVERHYALGGRVEMRDGQREFQLYSHIKICFDGWGSEIECRPAEPLRTDSHPGGLPDPGDGWRWVLKGEAVEPGDKEYAPISGVWVMLESPSVNNGSRMVRRRLTSEQDELTDDDLNEIVDRQKQMESIVRRLAAIDMADYWTWRCAAASLINEAREVCDE